VVITSQYLTEDQESKESDGVVEWWSDGKPGTPAQAVFHYSIIPILHYDKSAVFSLFFS
jgi:hypothetical protein